VNRLAIVLLFLGALFGACHSSAPRAPERVLENGVEVVINGAEPYPVEGEPRALEVHEEFRIDLEDEAVAALGLSDVVQIALNSRGGMIVFGSNQGQGPFVFVFDERGAFVRAFLRRGQGPDEVEYPRFLGLTAQGEIPVHDTGTGKLKFFNDEGGLLRTCAFPREIRTAGRFGLNVLPNGNYLAQYFVLADGAEIRKIAFGVFDPDFRKLRDLLAWELLQNPDELENPVIPFPVIGNSRLGIYACNQSEGTDISVFDLDGRRMRTIRKPFAPVELPVGYEKTLREGMPPGLLLAKTLKLPRSFPAFQYFFADDDGRLFVATYEKDLKTGQNMCDVFSPAGVFILRVPLGYFDFIKMFLDGRPGDVVIRGDRLACVHEKESGFKEVIVSSCRWF